MPELWYRCFYWFVTRVYFARLTLLNPKALPQPGKPVLFLGLHRNGAVDGFVYYELLRQPTFLISTQLRRNWFARLFFHGIAVTRTKDQPHGASDPRAGALETHAATGPALRPAGSPNQASLEASLQHLRAGGQLFVFPEGTSSLGPRHLPFKSGAAWLLLDYLEAEGPPLQVIPVGIHYECPWAFRAKVEVVLGPPLLLEFDPGATRLQKLRELKHRIQTGLEAVGTNVASDTYQDHIQRLAYVTTLGTSRSYFKSLKALEPAIPEAILKAAAPLDTAMHTRRLLTHQGVPLVPMGAIALYAVAFAAIAPLVLAALVLNLPPLVAGWAAGKKFPDDRNVISLWKIMVGVPLFGLWAVAALALLLARGQPVAAFSYLGVTWLGLVLYYRVKKLAVALWNGLRYPGLRAQMLAFRETVLRSVPE